MAKEIIDLIHLHREAFFSSVRYGKFKGPLVIRFAENLGPGAGIRSPIL